MSEASWSRRSSATSSAVCRSSPVWRTRRSSLWKSGLKKDDPPNRANRRTSEPPEPGEPPNLLPFEYLVWIERRAFPPVPFGREREDGEVQVGRSRRRVTRGADVADDVSP